MHPPPDEPIHPGANGSFHGLEGSADEDLELSGPGDRDTAGAGERLLSEDSLPGGVDHTTAAVGAGGLGLALLGIVGATKRRRNRRRRA